jgi:hypothetical protein
LSVSENERISISPENVDSQINFHLKNLKRFQVNEAAMATMQINQYCIGS